MDWFSALTGLPSDRLDVVRAGILQDGAELVLRTSGRRLVAGRLTTPALAELPAPPTGPVRLRLREVVADVKALHADPGNAGAVFQVASQFNLLEMIGPMVTPEDGIARYETDQTQGPACAMACAAGTIYRNYFVPVGNRIGQSAAHQLDMLADLGAALGNAQGRLWSMVNGYVRPHPGGLGSIRIGEADRSRLRNLLRVGVQAGTEVTLPGAGHLVHQVYASALPIAYSLDPIDDWEPFARLVLEAAYLATFGAAHALGAPRLFLTRLGGGAFGNPSSWISAAMATALETWQTVEMDVVIVSYGRPDPANRPLLDRFAD
jgi:hypothetical protein